eukprot:2510082-Pleurochrysis_carterae.AAC.1
MLDVVLDGSMAHLMMLGNNYQDMACSHITLLNPASARAEAVSPSPHLYACCQRLSRMPLVATAQEESSAASCEWWLKRSI